MDDQKYLFEKIESRIGQNTISKIEIPSYITNNLKFDLWDWQKGALQYFFAFDNPEYEFEKPEKEPTHLMFNMATGTGKTLLMAALILYYYKKGYRNFIFFVNQNNIVDKTENNLIEKTHNKYLFRQNIVIDDKTINIKKVETFADNSEDIQIKFTSIHKLHNAVYCARENSVYLEQLQKKDIVMIGDEAHHLNAETKSKNGQQMLYLPGEISESASDEAKEKVCWENTVLNKILRKGKSKQDKLNNNSLLEFTATVPRDKSVEEKYRPKMIYKYELVDFLNAGYTKEINLISSSLEMKEKILQALLLNWYRHKIALKYEIPNFKSVILFRSKLIKESKKDFSEFLDLIKNIRPRDFDFLGKINQSFFEGKEVYEKGKSRVREMVKFIKDEKIKFTEIVDYIKYNFAKGNCIITNSEDNKATTIEKTSEEQEKLLNSLEDTTNHIRAIFTVKRLNEGWDVLNLFDIVRLYEGRDEGRDKKTGKRKAGDATVSEIQLIGRGVRYYPFSYNDKEQNKRKFDNDLENDLRILEEFYYHSDDDHRYLDELKRELKNKGFIQDNKIVKKFEIKKDFKDGDFYKNVKIFFNERKNNPERRKRDLLEIKKDFNFEYRTKDFSLKEEQVDLNKDEDLIRLKTQEKDKRTIPVKLKDFDRHIVAKAINMKAKKDKSMFRFNLLKEELEIESIENIIQDNFLGDFDLKIVTIKDNKSLIDIVNIEQLDILLEFFEKISISLKEINNPYLGSEFKGVPFSQLFDKPKEKSVKIDEESENLEIELTKQNWYVLNAFNGTGEERSLVNFLKDKIGNLEEKYEEVYLLRNEEVYKIYDFKKGRGFEPDFLLFLKKQKIRLYYQVFIEPKGEQFTDKKGEFKGSKEGWKEEFLEEIMNKYGGDKLLKYENDDYKLIGLPLFNTRGKPAFEKVFNAQLLDD